MRKSQYIILDTETTGLSPRSASLTELYAARTNGNGKIIDEFHSLMNPGRLISPFITRLTGITNDMVKNAPRPREVLPAFHEFLSEEDIVVGHNLGFDLNFLNHASARNQHITNNTLCTLLLSRRVMAPNPLPSYKLGNLAQHFGLSADGAHRAKADVEMTIGVKQQLFKQLEKVGAKNVNDVIRMQCAPLRKAAAIMCGEKDRFFSQ